MDNIKNVIETVISRLCVCKDKKICDIYKIWDDITTVKENKHSEVDGFKDKKIYIKVDSSTWLYYFKSNRKKILKKLKENMNDNIENIVFKIGKINNKEEPYVK